MKSTALLAALAIFAPFTTALADPPILVSSKAKRTTTGFTFTAKWNPNTPDDVFPLFFFKPANDPGANEEIVTAIPSTIRGIKPTGITVTGRASGLKKGVVYKWRALAGGNETTSVDMPDQFVGDFVPAGTYRGAAKDANSVPRGVATVSVTGSGAITGSILVKGFKLTLRGHFDNAGTLTLHPKASGGAIFDVTLTSDSLNNVVKVHIESGLGIFSSDFDLHAKQADLSLTTPHAGHYTVVFTVDPAHKSDTKYPRGDSIATLTLKNTGRVSGSVNLADGKTVAVASFLDDTGFVNLGGNLSSPAGAPNPSYFAASLFIHPNGGGLDGSWSWRRAGNPAKAVYPDGFETNNSATGALYTPPSADLGASQITLSGGNFGADEVRTFGLTAKTGKISITIDHGDSLKLRLSLATGIVNGTFIPHPLADVAKVQTLRFVLGGSGFFLDGSLSGHVGN